jgi:flagellin
MTAINTNTGSLYAQQSLNTNARSLATVMQQLSTGKRINNAVDDVAGLAISTRLTSQIRGLNQAVRNANDGISLVQTAEGATEQITNMLQRMRELAVQASNDTNNTADRGFLNGEFQQLKSEINRVAQNTQWNGSNILDGTGGINSDGSFAFQVGANANQMIKAQLSNMGVGTALQTGYTTMSAGVIMDVNTAKTASFNFGTAVGTGTGAARMDLSTADENNAVGTTFQVSIDGKNVQYTITQDDADAANLAVGATGYKRLADSVASGLGLKLSAALASNSAYTVDYTTTVGTLKVINSSMASTAKYTAGTSAAPTGTGVANLTVAKGALSMIGAQSINVTTGSLAYTALGAIDSALQTVNEKRSAMGAIISRLQFASDNLSNVSAKATESRSRIEDTDYSEATTELAKRNIIQQAAQAMLAQANQAPQLVLQLLK